MVGLSANDIKHKIDTEGSVELPVLQQSITAKQDHTVLITEGYINGRQHEVLWDTGALMWEGNSF